MLPSRHKNTNTIKRKLLWPMLAVIVIQAVLFAGTIFGRGTVTELNNNSFDILNERVLNLKNSLQNDMLQHWSHIGATATTVNNHLSDFLLRNDVTYETLSQNVPLTNAFLDEATTELIMMLRQTSVTGAYLILDSGPPNTTSATRSNYGVYIRNLDPISNTTDNSGLLFDAGSANIARHYHIPLNSQWASRVLLPENSRAFFDKPYQAALEHPEISAHDLGYWGKPFQRSSLDLPAISYSMPLIDKSGHVYGVLGIDLTLDYLRTLMPVNDLRDPQRSSYVLAIDDSQDDALAFSTILANGPLYHTLFGDGDTLSFQRTETYKNIYALDTSQQPAEKTYGALRYLQLYNNNTPFANEHWALIGLATDHSLLSAGHKLTRSLCLALVLSLLIGSILILITSEYFTKPIINLVKKVRGSDPEQPVLLNKIGIAEIDELATAIESLSHNVADSASKLSKIIELLNMPLGAFEYAQGTERVFCSDATFDILNLERQGDSSYVPLDIFLSHFTDIQAHQEPDSANTYQTKDSAGYPCWLKIQVLKNPLQTWGIIMDVTRETLDKRRIEYERDYDLLTKLLNRRSFNTICRKKFQSDNLQISAFMMWDLDNLKYINDTYGHDHGDEYLRQAASVLQRFTAYNGIVARISGDEFYVFMSGFTDKETPRKIIGRIHLELQNMVMNFPNGNSIKLSASAGMAWYPDDSQSYDLLLKYADFAMYQAKHSLKGSIREFEQTSYLKDSFLLSSKEELDNFIDNVLVDYAFQPIVSATDGSILAYEALMRPRLDSLKSPQDILRLARYQSKLHEIEHLTFFNALADFDRYRDNVAPDIKLFVNSVSSYIMPAEDIADFEARYPEYLHRLVIELIESEQTNQTCTRQKQDIIARWHGQIALDDFGAGYNNDVLLLTMTPDYAKVDMSIIKNIDTDPARQNILRNLLTYFKDSEVKVIAEGVETAAIMMMLMDFGVDYLQGYYLGKPNLVPQPIDPAIVAAIQKHHQKA